MQDKYGTNKAALGIRYLLKYIETGRQETFNIVMDCMNEVELWCLITSYCNNIDELLDTIPDFVLDNNFNTVVPEELTFEEAFGKGFTSNSTLKSKEQFKKIRGLLSHGKFKYENNLITVSDQKYEATFDLKWLERLTKTTLENERLGLKKGMSDISILSLVKNPYMSIDEFASCISNGMIQFYMVTTLSGNKETLANAISSKSLIKEKLTFETIFRLAIALIESFTIDITDTKEGIIHQLNQYYKEVEKCFGNKVKVENKPIKLSPELLTDEAFINLELQEKIRYLIRIERLDNPVRYNGIMLQNILELFADFREGHLKNLNLFTLRDAKEYLIKVYANIFFASVSKSKTETIVRNYPIEVKYVYAQSIYKEYLKILKRSYNELEEHHGSTFSKKYIYELLKIYSKLLEEAQVNDAYKEFAWKMRNGIIHNHIEFKDGFIRVYNIGKNIKINHYNKKTKTWELKEFQNKRIIWQMTCSIQDFISLLDELFAENSIEIDVNISKYRKRRNYLQNI